MMSSIRPDGYTEAERDELYNIIDKLPSEFFGGFGDWEALIVKAHAIVMRKQVDKQLSINPNIAKVDTSEQ